MTKTKAHMSAAALTLMFLVGGDVADSGTMIGIDQPHRVPWAFRVELRRNHITSLKRLDLMDRQDLNTHTPKWLAAMAAIDTEIAQMVAKLAKSHPDVRISSVTGRQNPGFIMRGSDEDARAMAADADVESVESLGAASELLENTTMNIWD